jgi:hypothetical protein
MLEAINCILADMLAAVARKKVTTQCFPLNGRRCAAGGEACFRTNQKRYICPRPVPAFWIKNPLVFFTHGSRATPPPMRRIGGPRRLLCFGGSAHKNAHSTLVSVAHELIKAESPPGAFFRLC